jgi:AcrR family transcriptional regulator
MKQQRIRRPRDPQATRAAILEAACSLLARDGPEGISLSQVVMLAGVNRGTAYQHFETREKLIEATMAYVSDKLYRAVLGEPGAERAVERVNMVDVTERLSSFAMENPELCRVWLLQILSSPDPSADPFWGEYAGSIGRFAATEMAQPGIDVEVFSIITLAGTFLWPIWARAHSHGDEERASLAHRFAREMLRLSLHGTLRPEKVPEVAAELAADPGKVAALRPPRSRSPEE